VLAALIYPFFAAVIAARVMAGDSIVDTSLAGLHMLALFGGWSANALSTINGLARRGLLAHAWVILVSPLHWMLLSLAAWRGVVELFKDPHGWAKTEHGLARSSRRTGSRSA
jgi:hypothetical protein